jgi:hypothetical protein
MFCFKILKKKIMHFLPRISSSILISVGMIHCLAHEHHFVRKLSESRFSCLRLRGGVSKYYNHTAPPNRGGVFEEPKAGVSHDEGQSLWNKGGWSFEEVGSNGGLKNTENNDPVSQMRCDECDSPRLVAFFHT